MAVNQLGRHFLFVVAILFAASLAPHRAEAKPLTCSAVFRGTQLDIDFNETSPKTWMFYAFEDDVQIGWMKVNLFVRGVAKIDMLEVDRDKKNQGIAVELFASFVNRLAHGAKIETELAFDNEEAFVKAYEAMSKPQSTRYIEDKRERAIAAVQATPAYRIRARFGYTVIESLKVDWSEYEDGGKVEVTFTVAKPLH